jgi:predicted transcriptional regulator of viral defense system
MLAPEKSTMTNQLEFLNTLMAEGRQEFTFEDAKTRLGRSPSATANALQQLGQKGLVDRLSRGHYAIRPLGSLGTSTATENLPRAVGATLDGREHRIAYLSALNELGLLIHPVRTVFVACTHQARLRTISRRPLRVVIERAETIHLEAEPVEHSWRSTLERALFECALRVDLAGGAERLAEALAKGASEADPARIARLAKAFSARGFAAERRLASLAQALAMPLGLEPTVTPRQPVIRLDPRDDHIEWVDDTFRVAWNTAVDELRAVVRN